MVDGLTRCAYAEKLSRVVREDDEAGGSLQVCVYKMQKSGKHTTAKVSFENLIIIKKLDLLDAANL